MKCFTFFTQWSSVIYPDGLIMVESVECTLCLLAVLVRCFWRQSVVPCCSILPKHEEETENPSARSLLTCHVFAQLSYFVAVRQGMCWFYLTSYCEYALFSFFKLRQKDQNGKKKLAIKLPTERGIRWLSQLAPRYTCRLASLPPFTF